MKIKKEILFMLLSLLGIALMLIIAHSSKPDIINIKNLTSKMLDQQVSIQGKVYSYRFFGNSSFEILDIKDKTGNITGIINSKEEIKFNKTQIYLISGKVSIYNNETQIVVDKILLKG
jgi:DNA/RNA endonuclease YhcR with UshA esterase domain